MYYLLTLLCFLPAVISHRPPRKPCLTVDSVAGLLDRWFAAWTAPDPTTVPALVANVVTEDFTYTDETLNFGVGACVAPPEGPIVFSRNDFAGLLAITIAEATIMDEAFEVLDTVIECEKVAFRWLGTGKAVGNVLPNVTALPGDSVRWKGTDIFHVDLSNPNHPLVKSAVSSSDWFWFQYYTGAKVVFQKNRFPVCLCQDPVPGLAADGSCIASPTAKLRI